MMAQRKFHLLGFRFDRQLNRAIGSLERKVTPENLEATWTRVFERIRKKSQRRRYGSERLWHRQLRILQGALDHQYYDAGIAGAQSTIQDNVDLGQPFARPAVMARVKLASAYDCVGRGDEAMALFELIEEHHAQPKPGSHDAIEYGFHRAVTQDVVGDGATSAEAFIDLLPDAIERYGEASPWVVSSIDHIARCFINLDESDSASVLLASYVDTANRVYGRRSLDALTMRARLARVQLNSDHASAYVAPGIDLLGEFNQAHLSDTDACLRLRWWIDGAMYRSGQVVEAMSQLMDLREDLVRVKGPESTEVAELDEWIDSLDGDSQED